MPPRDDELGWRLPPSSTPRRVRGGIRLQSRRGGTQWWTRRWLAAFEAAAVGERLAQGLADARRGQVLDVEPGVGLLGARVQGARATPHEVVVELAPVEQQAWLRIARRLATTGASRAALLDGRMPDDVEAAFRREGCSLFPQLEDDLVVRCSCEDWSPHCRHVLAACLVASEAIDADPMLVLRLRGIEPELLQSLVAGTPPTKGGTGADADAPRPEPFDVDRFWSGPADQPPATLDLAAPAIDAPLVRILGAPPMWRGADAFETAMRRIHARVALDARTLELALGASGSSRSLGTGGEAR